MIYKDEKAFTEEEENKLESALGLEPDDLQIVLETAAFILEQVGFLKTTLVETILVETTLVEATLVKTTLVEMTLVETTFVEMILVETTFVETILVETTLVETTLVH